LTSRQTDIPFIAAFFVAIFTVVYSSAAELPVGNFSSGSLNGWDSKTFKGKTDYSLVSEDGKTVLKAESKNAASGLIKKISLDPKKYPVLRWSWKIAHTLQKEDITSKHGDDFSARVYVVFPRSFFWRARAINYVWAGKMAKGSAAASPFTDNVMVVAVETGDANAGKWVTEERNIAADYKKLFGEEPPFIGAVAVMTDTDNTGDEATAWYGDITLQAQ